MHRFEALTLAPIDKRLVVLDMLTEVERVQFNTYHARVLAEVGPLVDGEAGEWLKDACAPL
jgi:Xaa-Pro aminopeptidase